MEQKDGSSLRDHLEQVEKQTGKELPELDIGEIPYQGEHIFAWFYELDACRQFTEAGPYPLTFGDIMGWIELCQIIIEPWEIRAIKAIDNKYINVCQEAISKRIKESTKR